MNYNTKRHYIIYTGFFSFNPSNLNNLPSNELCQYFKPWITRFEFEHSKELFTNYLPNYFYSNFRDIIFPEIELKDYIFKDNYFPDSEELLEVYRSKIFRKEKKVLKLTKSDSLPFDLSIKMGEKIPFKINYIDYYFYNNGIGVFSFKVSISNNNTDIDLISKLIFSLRNFDNKIELKNSKICKEITVRDFINEFILTEVNNKKIFAPISNTDFNNKIKCYSVIELSDPLMDLEERRNLLYDIGTASPIGSAGRDNDFSPTQDYQTNLMDENGLFVYKNWGILNLLDTNTTLIYKPLKQYGIYESSETYYYPIYIYNLFHKVSLLKFSSSFSTRKLSDKRNQILRDDFVKFRNSHDLQKLSYNFLPELINHKMRNALDIETEIQRMEERVENIHSFVQEKQDKKTNQILTIISIISIASVIFSFFTWIKDIFQIPERFHSLFSILPTGIILTVIFFITFLLRDKK